MAKKGQSRTYVLSQALADRWSKCGPVFVVLVYGLYCILYKCLSGNSNIMRCKLDGEANRLAISQHHR